MLRFSSKISALFLYILGCLLIERTANSCLRNPGRSLKFSEICTTKEEVNVTGVKETQLTVRCGINCTTDLMGVAFPPKIITLILSHNALQEVQKGVFHNFTFLENLYLDYNVISHIDEGAFSQLDRLSYLDLSHNRLKTWNNPLKNDLRALQSLNLAHNEELQINKEQFMHTNCSIIVGVNISPKCKACNFTRDRNVTSKIIIKKLLSKYKTKCIYFPKESYAFVEEYRRKAYVSYNGDCTSPSKECSMTHLTNVRQGPLFKHLKDVCYRGTRNLRPIVYVLGSFALVLNLVVLTSILSITKLRRLVPFLLVAHLSFCDMLMGIYAIGVAVGHEMSPDFHDIAVYRTDNSKCPVFWVLFLFGQTLGVCTCVLVTIERYLATVYCMKPMWRLELQTTLFILPGFWVIAVVIAFPLQLIDYKKITLNFMCVLLRDYSAKKGFFVSQGLMIAYLILYIIIVFLYVRIYISVRNSSRQAGVDINREARLARRIGIIIFTNFICFALPNLSMLVFTTSQMYVNLDDVSNTIIRRWLPPMVLVLNACANPCFFAYGNDKFSSSLKTSLRSFVAKYLGVDSLMGKDNRIAPSIAMNKTASTSAATD